MPQTKNPDDLQLIASHPGFCVYPVMVETAKGVEDWILRANLRKWHFARNRSLSRCAIRQSKKRPHLINAEHLF